MKNKLLFNKHLNDSVKIKIKSDEKWKDFNNLKTCFDKTFPIYKGNFKVISDWIYYLGGGWPRETSKGRMEEALDKFATAYIFLTLINRQNIANNYLNRFGISINLNNKNIEKIKFDLNEKNISKFKSSWKKVFGVKKSVPKNSIDLVNDLVNKAQELQRDICNLADKIKIDIVEDVKEDCELSKRNFLQCVSLGKINTKEKEKLFKKKKTEIIKEKINEFHEAIKTIK